MCDGTKQPVPVRVSFLSKEVEDGAIFSKLSRYLRRFRHSAVQYSTAVIVLNGIPYRYCTSSGFAILRSRKDGMTEWRTDVMGGSSFPCMLLQWILGNLRPSYYWPPQGTSSAPSLLYFFGSRKVFIPHSKVRFVAT